MRDGVQPHHPGRPPRSRASIPDATTLAGDLRSAAGPNVKIIGTTYPDVILEDYAYPHRPPSATAVNLAKLWIRRLQVADQPRPVQVVRRPRRRPSVERVRRAGGAYRNLNRKVKTKAYGTSRLRVTSLFYN